MYCKQCSCIWIFSVEKNQSFVALLTPIGSSEIPTGIKAVFSCSSSLMHTNQPVIVSASLQSGGAGCVSSWLHSPSLTYCSSRVGRCSGSGSGSGSRSGAGGREGAGEASLAHLSLVGWKRGHGPPELALLWTSRGTKWGAADTHTWGGERKRTGDLYRVVRTSVACSSTPINALLPFPTESLTLSAGSDSAACHLPASCMNHNLQTPLFICREVN